MPPRTIIRDKGAFPRLLRTLLKKYPRCEKFLESSLSELASKPQQGDLVPGMGDVGLRKLRLPLEGYDIGKSGGIRIFWIAPPDSDKLVFVAVYTKKDHKHEHDRLKLVRQALKELLDDP